MTKGPKLYLQKKNGMSLRKREPLLSSGTSVVFLDRGPRRAANKRCPDAQRILGKLQACR